MCPQLRQGCDPPGPRAAPLPARYTSRFGGGLHRSRPAQAALAGPRGGRLPSTSANLITRRFRERDALIGRRFCSEQRLGESLDGAGEIEAVIEAPLESGEISVAC